jgi:hypothetical protein
LDRGIEYRPSDLWKEKQKEEALIKRTRNDLNGKSWWFLPKMASFFNSIFMFPPLGWKVRSPLLKEEENPMQRRETKLKTFR